MKQLTEKELALVLAGLRLLQEQVSKEQALPVGIYDILVDGEAEYVTTQQLDRLCAKLNK